MDMIVETRNVLQPEGVGVANAHGETLYDPRLQATPGARGRFGPFQSLSNRYKFLGWQVLSTMPSSGSLS